MLKENYRKIGKKKDNDMDANMAQLKRNNNKCYISTLMCVCVCVCVCADMTIYYWMV